MVPHRSTNWTRQCLTSLSRREAVFSLLYGRSWREGPLAIYKLIIYLYTYPYFHAYIRVHILNTHAMLYLKYSITHLYDLHTPPSAYKEEVSLLSCNSYYTQCSDKRQNMRVNPNQLPQDDTCSIHKFHPYSQYSIHAMDRRIVKYVRKCIIPINVSAGIVIDGTYCTMTPFVPNVSQNDTCYYAARYSHEGITSNFRSRNCCGGIGIRCQCFPFRQRGGETKREKV